MNGPGWYQAFLFSAALISFLLFRRAARKNTKLGWIYLGGLIGGFAGAKMGYFLVEGWSVWHEPHRWQALAAGKTVLGALPGGYAGVEIAKKLTDYKQTTGDYFALVAPLGIALGRIGCLVHGCCPGRLCSWPTPNTDLWRWPAVQVEMGFNIALFIGFLLLRRRGFLAGQHFHLYLMGYGLFRIAHEPLRDTIRYGGIFPGYSLLAAAVFVLGLWGFLRRQAANR